MLISPEFKRKVEAKYLEMKESGLTEGDIDTGILGAMKVFVNQKPTTVIYQFEHDSKTLYVGANM
jgi:hypothetical protein